MNLLKLINTKNANPHKIKVYNIARFTETFPEPGSYQRKGIGGAKVPGMIVKDFAFTL